MKRRLPTYNISGVLKLKEKIIGDLSVVGFMYTQPGVQEFEEFTELLIDLLPDNIPRDAIIESCEHLLGRELTDEVVSDLAWRLAGNVGRLRNGHAVLPWSGIPNKEWMPVQIVHVTYDVTRRGEPGGRFTFKFLAGQAAPGEAEKFWPKSYCHVLATRLGFTKFTRSKYPFQDAAEFTNLRLLVAVEPGSLDIQFEEVAVTSSAKEWNQKYIRMRHRTLPGFECPRKLPEAKTCFRCYFGQDKCVAAVRPETLIKLLCPQCDFVKYFDPAHTEVCVGCHQQNIRKEKQK